MSGAVALVAGRLKKYVSNITVKDSKKAKNNLERIEIFFMTFK